MTLLVSLLLVMPLAIVAHSQAQQPPPAEPGEAGVARPHRPTLIEALIQRDQRLWMNIRALASQARPRIPVFRQHRHTLIEAIIQRDLSRARGTRGTGELHQRAATSLE